MAYIYGTIEVEGGRAKLFYDSEKKRIAAELPNGTIEYNPAQCSLDEVREHIDQMYNEKTIKPEFRVWKFEWTPFYVVHFNDPEPFLRHFSKGVTQDGGMVVDGNDVQEGYLELSSKVEEYHTLNEGEIVITPNGQFILDEYNELIENV